MFFSKQTRRARTLAVWKFGLSYSTWTILCLTTKHPAVLLLTPFFCRLGVSWSKELTEAWFEIENRVFEGYLTNQLSLQEHRRERLRQFLPLTDLSVPGGGSL